METYSMSTGKNRELVVLAFLGKHYFGVPLQCECGEMVEAQSAENNHGDNLYTSVPTKQYATLLQLVVPVTEQSTLSSTPALGMPDKQNVGVA